MQRSPKVFFIISFHRLFDMCCVFLCRSSLFIFFLPPLQTQFPMQMVKEHSKINPKRMKKKSQMYQSAPQMGTNLSSADLERLGKSLGFVVGFCIGLWVFFFFFLTDKSKNSCIRLDRFSLSFSSLPHQPQTSQD